jgi:predicted Rossmann fold flavoprotein
MTTERIVVVGGGAAGFFAAITAAEQKSGAEIRLLEKSPQFLAKVKISGGGRCNVTHACFNEREFATRYPRGERALIAPFQQFQAADTVAWFEARGVKLKTEADGRMFPVTDDAQTIVDCLLNSARAGGVKLQPNCGVEQIVKRPDGGFDLALSTGQPLACQRVLLATGGCRTAALGGLAVSLGHTLEPPVPSLFTFHLAVPWLRELSGVSVDPVELTVPGEKLRERGPLLVTHWGLSGPVVLRLSAWGARRLHACNYQFPLHLNWLPAWNEETLGAEFERRRQAQPAKQVVNFPVAPLSARLWTQLVAAAGLAPDTRWAALSRTGRRDLLHQLLRTEFRVTGKSLNKDEFVTCGGVRLSEVDFKTMGSRLCPGLFFAGEVLDVDGVTGGFNFQAAWTSGWLAGRSLGG